MCRGVSEEATVGMARRIACTRRLTRVQLLVTDATLALGACIVAVYMVVDVERGREVFGVWRGRGTVGL